MPRSGLALALVPRQQSSRACSHGLASLPTVRLSAWDLGLNPPMYLGLVWYGSWFNTRWQPLPVPRFIKKLNSAGSRSALWFSKSCQGHELEKIISVDSARLPCDRCRRSVIDVG